MDNKNYASDSAYEYGGSAERPLGVNRFMAGVFGWMFLGLIVTLASGIASLFVVSSLVNTLSNPSVVMYVFIPALVAELFLVFLLSSRIHKMSPVSAALMFLLYAALNGITLMFVGMLYSAVAVITAIAITVVIFGIMAVLGLVTDADLTGMGKISLAGLLGLIVISLINMFLKSGPLDYMISIAGLFIFLGLTAYDAQKIKSYYYSEASASGEAAASKLAVIGALNLYLDFVNLFLYVLRILGRRR